ncbi:MAG: Sulfite oxidase [Planctomycetaceae bacterium]|nr:Sulfite oxidase [Planctomycetaceae bacterium]
MAIDVFAASRLNRRDCLGIAAAGVGLWFQPRSFDLFAADAAAPARHDLLVRTETPFNAEPRLAKLPEGFITPVENFFVRNHGNQPTIDPQAYRLTIDGAVDKSLSLSLAELTEKSTRVSVTATVTCAGNRRIEFAAEKPVPGVPWDAGAIGTAEWSGVRLSEVLKHAGIKAEAKHVWFEGQDQIMANGQTRTFGGSIPLATALDDETAARVILADRMNGKPLTAEHGFPLRTIVPGYIGARSVKWLSKITVSDRPSSNFYLAQTYRLVKENTPENVAAATPIYEFLTNSAICEAKPVAGTGKYVVKGYALAGGHRGNRISEINLTIDGGQKWQPAKIVSPVRDFGWVLWSAEIDVPAGTERIQVKATDSEGTSQPARSPWNAQGYQYNGWHSFMVKKSV